MNTHFTGDAMQANLGFVVSQIATIEPTVYAIKYPDLRYRGIIPIEAGGNPWAKTVTYYSMDGAGKARWVADRASDIPVVGLQMDKGETTVQLAGIGYDYGIEEVNQARMLGIPLEATKAQLARRISEEMIDRVALEGDSLKGFSGLFNYAGVTAATAPNGAAASPLWANKTADEMAADINLILSGVASGTSYTSVADTILLPLDRLAAMQSKRLTGISMTALDFVRTSNIYTAQTGQPLTIRGMRGLETAGAGGTARIIAYRNSPDVLKMYVPMPLRFLDVQVQGLRYVVPGIFRLGGLDVRLPKEVRYLDGV